MWRVWGVNLPHLYQKIPCCEVSDYCCGRKLRVFFMVQVRKSECGYLSIAKEMAISQGSEIRDDDKRDILSGRLCAYGG